MILLQKILIISLIFLHIGNLKAQNKIWKLVWSDEFNYVGLPDSTKRNYDTKVNSFAWGNNEQQWYTKKEQKNSIVSNGTLKIILIKESINGKEYSSAQLITKKSDWKYWKVEVKAKLPNGNGT